MSNLSERVGEVLRILSKAEQKEIAGRRCFIVEPEEFFTVVDFTNVTGDAVTDPRLSNEGYNNVEIVLSSTDKERYHVACLVGKTLDELWEKGKEKRHEFRT
jgi:hypothetical protein